MAAQFTLNDALKFIDDTYNETSAVKYKMNVRNFLVKTKYQEDDLTPLLMDYVKLFQKIDEIYKSPSTRRSYYGAFSKLIKKFDDSEVAADFIKRANCMELKSSVDKVREKIDSGDGDYVKPFDEAVENIANIKAQYAALSKKLTPEYNNDRMTAAMLYMWINYGALRGHELMQMWIMPDDDHDKLNFVNLDTNEIVITDHKTSAAIGDKVFKIDKTLAKLLAPGVNGPLIPKTQGGSVYTTSAGVERKLKAATGFGIYDIRKSLISIALESHRKNKKNTLQLRKLEKVHGHSMNTMQDWYDVYRTKDLDSCSKLMRAPRKGSKKALALLEAIEKKDK